MAQLSCEENTRSTEPRALHSDATHSTKPADEIRRLALAHRKRKSMKKLFVGNLPHSTTEAELRTLFEPHGKIDQVSVVTDRDTGRSRGFAFVEMADAAEAEKAIAALNGKELGGRALNINEARPKTDRGGPGGPRRRGPSRWRPSGWRWAFEWWRGTRRLSGPRPPASRTSLVAKRSRILPRMETGMGRSLNPKRPPSQSECDRLPHLRLSALIPVGAPACA